MDRVVIIGAGQAGIQAATSLRSEGYEGEIIMVADEKNFPYQKPPLSKGFLSGKLKEANLLFKAEAFYEKKSILLKLGSGVKQVNTDDQQIVLESGEQFNYDHLIIATGARNRVLNLPGNELQGIHYLRNLEDCNALKDKLSNIRKLIVVGGGFIGLEIAAAANEKGIEVEVVEVMDRLMARVLPPVVSNVFEKKHLEKGVRLLMNKCASAFVGNGKVSGVLLDDDQELKADIVVVGIGVIPNYEMAEKAGIKCSNGIEVDEFTKTNIQNIYAIGDVALHQNKFVGEKVRLESVQNAMDQGKVAAANIVGNKMTYDFCPWFWTHQFELKLQMAGCNQGYDEYVIRGDKEEEKYSIFYLKDEKLTGVDSINRASDHMAARKLIQAGVTPSKEQIEDLDFKLKTLLS